MSGGGDWDQQDEQMTIIAVIFIVVTLLVLRSCLLPKVTWEERPAAPPESLYQPGR